jgi:outer membrane protein assembly factor BamB
MSEAAELQRVAFDWKHPSTLHARRNSMNGLFALVSVSLMVASCATAPVHKQQRVHHPGTLSSWLNGRLSVATGDGLVGSLAHGREKNEPPASALAEPVDGTAVLGNRWLSAAKSTGPDEAKQDREGEPHLARGYWPQWRGPDRSNLSQEKGLLQQWPAGGPPLLWKAVGLGNGIAPVSVAGGRIYTSGYHQGGEFAIALDEQSGLCLWTAYLGASVPEDGIHRLMRWLSQRAATVDDDRLYYVTALGELVCLQAADGKALWRKSYTRDFGARRPRWTFCDCPLVDGDRLLCTPGAREAAVVALNKKTGEVIWKAAVPGNSQSGYAPLMVAEVGGIRQYLAFLSQGLVGVAAGDGKLLWHYDRISNGTTNSHAPLVRDNLIFCANGYNAGIALLKLVPKNREIQVEELYFQKFLVSSVQDSSVPVLVGDYAYDLGRTGMLLCTEMKTGKLLWEAKGPRRGRGSLTYADGHLYVRYSNGMMTLVAATPKAFVEKGAFPVPGNGKALGATAPAISGGPVSGNALGATAPVIAGGRLYLRENETLFCYDIRSSALRQPPREPRSIVLPPPSVPESNLALFAHRSSMCLPLAIYRPRW